MLGSAGIAPIPTPDRLVPQGRRVTHLVPTMRGTLAVCDDGSTWFLCDPYVSDDEEAPTWERFGDLPTHDTP